MLPPAGVLGELQAAAAKMREDGFWEHQHLKRV
jgi:hypothetical protein